MFRPVLKHIITTVLSILCITVPALNFDLKVYVDKNGSPDPGGILFGQYFCRFWSGWEVVTANGRKYIFPSELNPFGIRKRHLDAINWEMEKSFRCEIFKLYQIKAPLEYNGYQNNSIVDFLRFCPEGSECIAPVFYLWQMTAGKNIGDSYKLRLIIEKMGDSGKKYAKIIRENRRQSFAEGSFPHGEMLGNYATLSLDKLVSTVRVNPDINPRFIMMNTPEASGKRVVKMLEQGSPTEIVKCMLTNKVIQAENFEWLTFFLGMCDEWPPEAVEFMKKQYINSDSRCRQMLRGQIVEASFKNVEMVHWLKPYMADFIANGKVSAKAGVAYMLIVGESDPLKVARDYVYDYSGFFYEYALATGKYNDACNYLKVNNLCLDRRVLYDKCDLSADNRMFLLKQFFEHDVIAIASKLPDGSINQNDVERILREEARLLHSDNLPVLLILTKDVRYAANVWRIIETFPDSVMVPDVARQCFAHCEQALRSQDLDIRKNAIYVLRFFVTNPQRAQSVKLLLNMLRSNNQTTVVAACDSITALGPVCIPELLEAVGGNEPYLALRACEFIGEMGLYGHEAAPQLIKQLNVSNDWILKTMIIKTLALIKATEAIPEIEKYVSAKQLILASTAEQALLLFKPIPPEYLDEYSNFVTDYNQKPSFH